MSFFLRVFLLSLGVFKVAVTHALSLVSEPFITLPQSSGMPYQLWSALPKNSHLTESTAVNRVVFITSANYFIEQVTKLNPLLQTLLFSNGPFFLFSPPTQTVSLQNSHLARPTALSLPIFITWGGVNSFIQTPLFRGVHDVLFVS